VVKSTPLSEKASSLLAWRSNPEKDARGLEGQKYGWLQIPVVAVRMVLSVNRDVAEHGKALQPSQGGFIQAGRLPSVFVLAMQLLSKWFAVVWLDLYSAVAT